MRHSVVLPERIEAFHALGEFLRAYLQMQPAEKNGPHFERWKQGLDTLVNMQVHHNAWFTKSEIERALGEWAVLLQQTALWKWVEPYAPLEPESPKVIGVVMAGNIPLVGFHDALSVLISGHALWMKPSSDDRFLIPYLLGILEELEPRFGPLIRVADGKLGHFDATIATGSDNSVRYFEYYFGHKPAIIRGNRSSVAVLTGDESEAELNALAGDCMNYFGLGCRSVSQIFLPKNFELNRLFQAIYSYKDFLEHNAYTNNYDYHRSIFLMNKRAFHENGFFILMEEASLHSPISVLHYTRFEHIREVKAQLALWEGKIQAVVSKRLEDFENAVLPGQSQKPALNDYADGVDTLAFLKSLN